MMRGDGDKMYALKTYHISRGADLQNMWTIHCTPLNSHGNISLPRSLLFCFDSALFVQQ